ncbi:hypothetical protein TRFO_36448 [Tritrichomonas foetus]|uniref:Uncharacterized protein n=1 Tax=Tritrichomonas foetus TaxID=1144522 RepID=A0A1J4JFA5_9EUKA|nr:hypothetical protein TRFO_36448 [Tritrichomonas foetus]|eukprot:OHS97353.1 hypothetical protein TRFO_36448 [Tritrichomonas foetus]
MCMKKELAKNDVHRSKIWRNMIGYTLKNDDFLTLFNEVPQILFINRPLIFSNTQSSKFFDMSFPLPPKEDVANLIMIFRDYLSTDNTKIKNAQNAVSELSNQDIIKLILTCSAIVLSDDAIEDSAVFYALMTIRDKFTPSATVTENMIAQPWLQISEEIRNYVKQAIVRGLMFQKEQISNMAANAFAKLLNIEKMQMFSLIPHIYELTLSSKYPEPINAAAIDVLAQIAGPESLGGHTDIQEVQAILLSMFEHVGRLFTECTSRSIPFQYNTAVTISTFLDVAGVLFTNQEIAISLINVTIQLLESVPDAQTEAGTRISPDTLHYILLEILFKLTKVQYSNAAFDFTQIGEYVCSKIKFYAETSSPDTISEIKMNKISNLIQFWVLLATYEKKILHDNKYIGKYNDIIETKDRNKNIVRPKYLILRNFCAPAMERLIPSLLHFLSFISSTEQSSEDINYKQPHMFATCCLQCFFKINPQFVFICVRNLWMSVNPFEKEWPYMHALILMISIISRKPQHMDVEKFLIYDPIAKNNDGDILVFRDILLNAIESPIMRIVDTTVYTICIIIKHYGNVLTIPNTEEKLINWIDKNKTTSDPVIFTRLIYLICSLMPKTRSPRLFHLSYDIYNIAIHQQSVNSDNYIGANILLCNAIKEFPQCVNEIAEILKRFIDELTESTKFEDEYSFFKQQQILSVFNAIFSYKNHAFQDYVPIVTKLCFTILNKKNNLFEDALHTLGYVIKNIAVSSDKLMNDINHFVDIALTSQSPSIITITTLILAYLYENVVTNHLDGRNFLIEQIPNTLSLIINCLHNEQFTRDFYPVLLKALAMVMSACSYTLQQNVELVDKLVFEYDRFSQMPIELKNENDYEYANSFYESIFKGATSILKCLQSGDERMKNRKFRRLFITTVPAKYLLLEGHFNSPSLYAFCEYIIQYNKVFGCDGNIILNRLVNYKIIYHAICAKDIKVSVNAEKVLTVMHHA